MLAVLVSSFFGRNVMATTSFTNVRRFAVFAFTLLFSLCLLGKAVGQDPAPLVTASSATGLDHKTGSTWGAIQQTAIDSNGDWLVVDTANSAVYEFPAGGGPAVVLAAPGSLGGGWQNPGIAIDPGNNLYLEANWNNCLLMFPWDPVAKVWTGLSTMTPGNPSTTICTNSGKGNQANAWAQSNISDGTGENLWPWWYQPWGIAIGKDNNLIIGTQTNGQFIFSLSVNGAWSNPQPNAATWIPITNLKKRPISVAQDQTGNIYFVEDSGGLAGVYEVPASVTNAQQLQSDKGLTRVDPNLPAVTGVITDSKGNLYISDSQLGVVMVPNTTGVPDTANAVVISAVPAQGEVAIDWTRNTLYVPTTQKQTNGQSDAAKVSFGHAEFGSSIVGTAAAAPANVSFGFNGSVTPGSFVIVESGVSKPDFAITGGTCTTGIAYAAVSSCVQNIAFTPSSVGNISAKLMMLDDKQNVLASIMLRGTGIGANAQVAPGLESTMGAGLKAPTQIAADLAGNIYAADPGLGKVLLFLVGSSTPVSVGSGLTAPTGVAVNGAGDVFIADSGKVYMVPFGPSGLNASGQVQLLADLGPNLSLAVDGRDNLYIADPTNSQVIKLANVGASVTSNFGQSETRFTAGFTAPSTVAVDASANVYVIDGANLFELVGGVGNPVSLLNTLSGATGLAVDPSGAAYITSASGTIRIPSANGALDTLNQTTIAPELTNASSVVLDRTGTVYLVSNTGGSITVVSSNGILALPTPGDLTSSTSATATVTNIGNAPLVVTAYTNSTTTVDTVKLADFTAADGTCVNDSTSPGTGVAAGSTCTVVVTFNPQSGEEGTLTGQIGITSNAVNLPITINASGQALPLSGSAATVSATGAAEVVNTVINVTVAAKSPGGPVPTGTVALTYESWTVVIPSTGSNAGIPTINPVPITVPAQLDSNGKATFTVAPVLAGAQTLTVGYAGDRVYGRTSGTVDVVVAKSAISGITLPTFPDKSDVDLPFVIAGTGGGTTPYDGSVTPWQYQFKMKVETPFGVPTGTVDVMDDSSTCPAGTSASGVGKATCALTGYKGLACPQSAGSATLRIQNAGTPTGAQAQFSTTCLWNVPQGTTYSPVIFTHSITPVYSGDANFQAFTGPTPTMFQAVRGPLVHITKTGDANTATAAPSLDISSGSSASIDLAITSILGYGFAGRGGQLNNSNFPISLTCDIPLPHAACAITYDNSAVDPNQITAPNSVQIPCPAGATNSDIASGKVTCTPGHAKVTVYTNVAVGTTTSENARVASVTLATLFGFGMIGLFFRRRSFEKRRLLLMALLIVISGALAVTLTACSTTNLSPQTQLKTPAGTYQMTITAQPVGTQCIALTGAGSNCTTSSGGSGVFVYGSNNQVSVPFYVNVTVH
jgi:hypothetical protein